VRIGVQSIFIVSLVSASIGFILALQMAPPLESFGSVELVPNIVGVAVFRYRARGGHQRLADHLPAVHTLPALARAGRPVVVLFDLFEIQQIDELVARWFLVVRHCGSDLQIATRRSSEL